MKFKQPDKPQTIKLSTDEDKPSDKLDMLKFSTAVQSRIKEDIKEDFTLAKLTEKDKEAVIEMTTNAYQCQKLIQTIIQNARYKEYDHETQTWQITPLRKEDLLTKRLLEIKQRIFDTIMVRILMTTIMNRNVDANHLIRMIADYHEEETQEEVQAQETETALQSIMKKVKKQAKKSDED